MKSKKVILYGIFLIGATIVISACSESFLEPKPKGQDLESEYYSSPERALAGVIAAYGAMGIETKDSYCSPLGPSNSASDDCYAGGGGPTDMSMWQAMNNFNLLTPANNPTDMWKVPFIGINNCNIILSKFDKVPGLSETLKKRYIAEVRFLRAYYYFRLIRWYKNVPLYNTAQTMEQVYASKQASPEEVYAQIEQDLLAAIPDLPPTVPANENGRATQGAAKAWLGKVYLFQQKWADAAKTFKDVNGTPGGTSQYGYKLMANYGDIFNQKFNSESIFEIQKTSTQNYDWGSWGNYKSNVYSVMIGPRVYSRLNPAAPNYLSGWSFNPITSDLHDAMIVGGKYDPRYKYTITNLDSLQAAGLCKYDKSQCYMGTGYFMVKFAPLQEYTSTTGVKELNFGIDYIELRLADSYLMEAEALVMSGSDNARAQALLDAVRGRVGLASVPVNMESIKYERRMELATEGHRFFDLVRWGDAEKVLNNMNVVSGLGMDISFDGSKHFIKGKNEILPIPLAEFTNTNMVQNPGY